MNVTELREQSATLLPGREALGHIRVTFAKVNAYNAAMAENVHSWCATAVAGAAQNIYVG